MKRIKSVATQCIDDLGLYQACANDVQNGGFPFKSAVALLKRAMSLDGAHGGCDDVPPPPLAQATQRQQRLSASLQQTIKSALDVDRVTFSPLVDLSML